MRHYESKAQHQGAAHMDQTGASPRRNCLAPADEGVIFRNPLPGHRVINACFPFIHVLADGEWLCVLRTGGAMYSPDGMLELFRSSDGGKTWQRQGPVRDRREDPVHYNYREASLITLQDGSLVMRLTRVEHSKPELLIYNPETQGLLPHEACYMRSADAGRTWQEPVVASFEEPFEEQLAAVPCGSPIELADGTWFQAFETWKAYENDGPFDLNTFGLFSIDGGRTWGRRVPIAVGTEQGRSYSHGRPIRLTDGRLYCVVWTADAQLDRFHDLHAVTSTDATGRRWTPPMPLGVLGQTSCAADFGGGRLVLVYSHRENTEKPGIKAVLSEDGGRTWDLDRQIILWDAYGRESLGVAATDTYPSSHDAIAYGAPQAVRLDEHQAIASFWCTRGADTHCRWCRIRIT